MGLPNEYPDCLGEKEKRVYSTLSTCLKDLDQFNAYLRGQAPGSDHTDLDGYLLSATPQDIQSYLLHIKGFRYSISSVFRKVAILRGFYGYLLAAGRLGTNPCAGTSFSRDSVAATAHIDPATLHRVIETIPERNWMAVRDMTMIALLYNTGMRLSELLCVRADDIDWRNSTILVRKSPTYMEKCKLWAWVGDYVCRYDHIRKFLGWPGDREFFISRDLAPLSACSFSCRLTALGQRAGLSVPLTATILRNSYAVLMLDEGIDPTVLQQQLGTLMNLPECDSQHYYNQTGGVREFPVAEEIPSLLRLFHALLK